MDTSIELKVLSDKKYEITKYEESSTTEVNPTKLILICFWYLTFLITAFLWLRLLSISSS